MNIEGRLLYRGVKHLDGSLITNECEIYVPEKVPIVYETKLYDAIGFATVTKDNLGLIFTGQIKDDADISKYPGCGGFYTNVKSTKPVSFGPNYDPPFKRLVTSMTLKSVMLVARPILPDYVYTAIQKDDINKMIHVDFGYSGDRCAVTEYSILTGKHIEIRKDENG